MDPQLSAMYESSKKDLYELMQECESYCQQEYNRGQQEVLKQMLMFCNQQTGGDIRKMNVHGLINYLISKKNQLLQQEDVVMDPLPNNKKHFQYQGESQMININQERLRKLYQELSE